MTPPGPRAPRASLKRPRRWAAAGLVTSSLVLAGCVPPLPQPTVPPELEYGGAVLDDQAASIVADLDAALATADAVSNPALFASRVEGDAALIRAAEYTMAAQGGAAPDEFPSASLAVYDTDADGWPRGLVVVTEAANSGLTPAVLMFQQDDARSPYTLRQWAHMIPGAVLPAMATLRNGAEQLRLDEPGLSMTPRQAIEAYAALLTSGEPEQATFAPDTYRERMFAARTALTASATARSGTYLDTITARPDEAIVFATAEGGALVFLPITVTTAFTVPGAQLTLTAPEKALLDGTLSDRVVYHYRDLVVINVPKDASLLPTVVAADHHLVDVTLKVDG